MMPGMESENTEVHLTGFLICADAAQDDMVRQHLPQHIALTRAEAGCLEFDVTPSGRPGTWQVRERFANPDAFRAHQARVAASEWGRATADIARRYEIDGLDEAT